MKNMLYAINNIPKPHYFVTPLQSGGIVVAKLKICITFLVLILPFLIDLCCLLISHYLIPLYEKLPVSFFICIFFLIVSASLTIVKLINSDLTIKNRGFFVLFEFLKKYPLQFTLVVLLGWIVACTIRMTIFSFLDLDKSTISLYLHVILIFCTWLPIVYTIGIINQLINCTKDLFIGDKEIREINIDFSLNSFYINQAITWKNLFLVLIFATWSYSFLTLFSLFLVVSYMGCSKDFILSSLKYMKYTLTSLRLPPNKMIIIRSVLPAAASSFGCVLGSSEVNSGIIEQNLYKNNLYENNNLVSHLYDKAAKTHTPPKNTIVVDIGYIVDDTWKGTRTLIFDHLDKTCSNLKLVYGEYKNIIIRPLPNKGQGWKGLEFPVLSEEPHKFPGIEHKFFQKKTIIETSNSEIVTLDGIWIGKPTKAYIESLSKEIIINSMLHSPRISKSGKAWFILRSHWQPELQVKPFRASLSESYALSEPRWASSSANNLRLLASKDNSSTGVTAPATPQGCCEASQNFSVMVPQSQESLNDSKN